eukprot:TRINITY_DN26804_c0_g1_i1.p1 TRINITY_DN26804_c0_g1~~TRINITY_DN26804_c0_g1_i1.p1  ORF type:complete len:761 (-),score=97.61 TRINITY_DN26804_c0_g1_i1:366-2648(-)
MSPALLTRSSFDTDRTDDSSSDGEAFIDKALQDIRVASSQNQVREVQIAEKVERQPQRLPSVPRGSPTPGFLHPGRFRSNDVGMPSRPSSSQRMDSGRFQSNNITPSSHTSSRLAAVRFSSAQSVNSQSVLSYEVHAISASFRKSNSATLKETGESSEAGGQAAGAPVRQVVSPQCPMSQKPMGAFRRKCRNLRGADAWQSNDSIPMALSDETHLQFLPSLSFLNVLSSPTAGMNEYASIIGDEVKRVLIVDHCSVVFVDQLRQIMCCVTSARTFNIPWNSGYIGDTACLGSFAVMDDVSARICTDRNIEKRMGASVTSALCFPIRHMVDPTNIIGVIEVGRDGGGSGKPPFDKSDAKLCDTCESIARVMSDSFYRHRWAVLESCSSPDDAEVTSLVSQTMPRRSQTLLKGQLKAFGNDAFGDANEKWQGCLAVNDAHGLHHARTLQFNALAYSEFELLGKVEPVLRHTGCKERFAVPEKRLHLWASAAMRMYRDNPFHNWYHAFSCFQMCYYQLVSTNISSHFSCLDTFSLLVAALCHDLDHPGFTNAFMVDSESELAIRYNDNAVLENHHASLACELLRQDDTAITVNMQRVDKSSMRRTIIRCILNTDMSYHKEITQKVQAGVGFLEDKSLTLSACIHAADLSAQVLPWDIAMQWESRISEEFVRQATAERDAGRTPAPFMDFRMDDVRQRGKLQRDFCDFVLLPLWDPLTQVLKELRPAYRNLVNNRSFYEVRFNTGEDPPRDRKHRARSTNNGYT